MNRQGTKIYNSNMSLITEAQFHGKWNKKSPTIDWYPIVGCTFACSQQTVGDLLLTEMFFSKL